MKNISIVLYAYGAFLILCGVTGYLSNPEKAKTALMSGGSFGLLNIGLGWLALRGWRLAIPAALGSASFLGLVFTWRASVSWMAFVDGQSEKLVAASIITAMLVATVALIAFLAWMRSRAGLVESR